jgi:protein-tyrosine-phosphatase
MHSVTNDTSGWRPILFVCLHGSAKSVIAAEYFNRLAEARGLALRAESAGIEPDPDVPAPVIAGLGAVGIDVREYVPRPVTRERLTTSAHIVTFGCGLSPELHPVTAEEWNDLPMVSDGFDAARDAIVVRVDRLLDRMTATRPPASPTDL